MPKISILVAVYNTAVYLPQCLDSLLSQTLKDIEVLCVDDASTDKSLEILHQYAEKDERVRVFALKENRGQAHARNVGLSHATGDYIGFVDSDDWLSRDALEKVCESFRDDVDSVLFRVLYAYPDGRMRDYEMSPFTTMMTCGIPNSWNVPSQPLMRPVPICAWYELLSVLSSKPRTVLLF